MARYIECSACGYQVHDLYKLAKDYSARQGDSGRVPLTCPQCKSSSATFTAYEGGEGSFY